MGASTARITQADFLIPPEFAGLELAARSAAQIGGVRLELVELRGQTKLGDCYHQLPLQVLPPFSFAGEPAALLYLLNPTVGLMDGDGWLIHIHARAGTRTVVTGQSASRIHPARRSLATQQWHVRVDAGAELVLLPGPAIPYRGSRFYQRVQVDLAPGARFIWADIWLPGRYRSQPDPEIHVFEHLVQDLSIRRADKLIFRDRFSWRGPWDDRQRSWHLGGNLASASLFATEWNCTISETEGKLVERAVLSLASGDTCVRACGEPELVLHDCVDLALSCAGKWSSVPPVPWLRSNNFGPNHWFSAPPGDQAGDSS